jgi:hypothetical protein
MDKKLVFESKEALREAANEIERLRRENEILSIKAASFETFSNFVALMTPKHSQGYGVDAVWVIRKLLAEIEASERSSTETAVKPDVES